jgi:hypothetical protein
MNHTLWTATGTRVLAVALALGLAACGERLSNTASGTPKPLAASPSAVLIGTAPAQPSGDPPGTTPVADATSEVTKAVESNAMPQPGQPNDHSNLASQPSQKGSEMAKTLADGQTSNSGAESSQRSQ